MRNKSTVRFLSIISLSVALLVPPSALVLRAQAEETVLVPTVNASLATVDLNVGPGQKYAGLQSALDAIPATPTSNYKVHVYPGTYGEAATLQGKNTSGTGATITIEGTEEANKPLFVGGSFLGSGYWTTVSGKNGVYRTTKSGTLAVTDRNENLKKVGSLEVLARSSNAWYSTGGKLYVKLFDVANPNRLQLTISTIARGLNVQGVANVLIKDLRFESYASQAILLENAPNSSVRSVRIKDVGRRASEDGGVIIKSSSNASVVNLVASSIRGAGVLATSTYKPQVLNGSFHDVVNGIELRASSNAVLKNNVFGTAFETPLLTDAPSQSGLGTSKNTYWNPSGVLGEDNAGTYNSLAGAPGGESGSVESDPLFRSTSSVYGGEVSELLNKVHDLDASLSGGLGWANNPNGANLAWDEGFGLQSLLSMYRATNDTHWLEKLVERAEIVWSQAYHNSASPGSSSDGYLGWATARYAVLLLAPSNILTTGADLRMVESNGTVLGSGTKRRVYGPKNGDSVPSETLELRFTSGTKYEIWDTSGTPTCVNNCGTPVSNYPGGKDVTVNDSFIDASLGYAVPFRFTGIAPVSGNIFEIESVAKKQLEYANIDARLTAPMAEFVAEVYHDPTIQNLPVDGSTFKAKADDLLSKIETNIVPKWEPYFKVLSSAPGSFGGSGGVITFPCDEQYSIPCHTNPVNMQADYGRMMAHLYAATGNNLYYGRARQISDFISSKMELNERYGQEYFFWNYFYRTGSWDTWTEVIPEDINHGALVARFVYDAYRLGINYNATDMERTLGAFTVQAWDPGNSQIYYYLNRTFPISYSKAIYWMHAWGNLPGGESVMRLVYDTYTKNSYSSNTGVIYETMADAALAFSRVPGSENYRLRPGSTAVRSGSNTTYDYDYDGRQRSVLGAFDRGAYSYIQFERLSGSNRYNTAIEISKAKYPVAGSARSIVVARGDSFADGLAGAPFAWQEQAPVLLTKPDQMLPEVLAEIRRASTPGARVYLLGGTVALSDGVAASLEQAGFIVERLSGVDRYETAAVIAHKLNNITEVFIANGTSFADPLAASAAAVSRNAAILLSKKDTLTAATNSFLSSRGNLNLHLVGGTAVLSDAVVDEAVLQGVVDRYAGSNRYSTATAVAEAFFSGANTATFATGENFPDSLVAGVHAGSDAVQAPLLLVKGASVPTETSDYLSDNSSQLISGYVYGGPAAVSEDVKATLESSL